MEALDRNEAERICQKLLNTPQAPGVYSHFINVGTGFILDSLEKNYFESALANDISCFKYLQGDYGAGKTQFINCLADRAWRHQIVTAIVSIGNECPFNSPLAIYRSVVSSFLPPSEPGYNSNGKKGIEILVKEWIRHKLMERGWSNGDSISPLLQADLERTFMEIGFGSRDMQAESGMRALGKMMLAELGGANHSTSDDELMQWVRGDKVQSASLKKAYGLHEPATDQNAFNRLKTVIGFLRKSLGYMGFLIAFDEGTRTASFRRGSVKQKQAIENMLTMINENGEGEFSGVMFLYAATPDFRSDVVSKYIALNDRIGSASFSSGRPMVPLIDLDELNTDDVIRSIGNRLLNVFATAYNVNWDEQMQKHNLLLLANAEKILSYKVIPRSYVYHLCMFLLQQKDGQMKLTEGEAERFVSQNILPGQSE